MKATTTEYSKKQKNFDHLTVIDELITGYHVYVMTYEVLSKGERGSDRVLFLATSYDDVVPIAEYIAEMFANETWDADFYEVVSIEKVSSGPLFAASLPPHVSALSTGK